jgi:LysM repeat protein
VAPTEAPAPTAAVAYVEYTVQRGDSLKQIAEKHSVTIRDIIAANQIPNPDSLNVGMVLRIPKK